jgi:hypothetical protein
MADRTCCEKCGRYYPLSLVSCPGCGHPEPRHHEHQALCFTLSHYEDTQVKIVNTTPLSLTRDVWQTTWSHLNKPSWIMNIARPASGSRIYPVICPHCRQTLSITLDSLAKIALVARSAGKRKFAQVLSFVLAFVAVFFVFLSFATSGAAWAIFGLIASAGVAAGLYAYSDKDGLPAAGIHLQGLAARSPDRKSPQTAAIHYIERIESF